MMILAALEKDGGGDVHKNTDYHREQLWRVWFQSGQGTDGRADGSHYAKNEEAKIGMPFGIAVMQQHTEEHDADWKFVNGNGGE